jgi:DNA-3-methyladenine glycosylase II
LYQQLSGKAAATIVGRVETAIKSKKINAVSLARIDDLSLRA